MFQRDITSLDKADNNNAQNVIDPYNLFLYPLDSFASGSEAGSFFLGNKTTRVAEVQPQNYCVVSSDKEVIVFAKKYLAKHQSSEDFSSHLKKIVNENNLTEWKYLFE